MINIFILFVLDNMHIVFLFPIFICQNITTSDNLLTEFMI